MVCLGNLCMATVRKGDNDAIIIIIIIIIIIMIIIIMTISRTKTQSMAMCASYMKRVKIVINDNIIEQVTDFKYLGVPYIRIQK